MIDDKPWTRYLEKYDRSGDENDLECALSFARQAYTADDLDNHELAVYANNYSEALEKKFAARGHMEDLMRSIELQEQAVKATPGALSVLERPEGTSWHEPGSEAFMVSNLANRLCTQFEAQGSLRHLNRVIEIMDRLLAAVPDHPDRHNWLNNLRGYLARRYEQGGSQDDLNRGLKVAEQALKETSEDDVDRPVIMAGLGQQLAQAACLDMHPTPRLDNAIELMQQAAHMMPEDHPRRISLQINLAMYIYHKWTLAGSTNILNQAIEIATSTMATIGNDHPERAHVSNFLGLFYSARFFQDPSTSFTSDAQSAWDHFHFALNSLNYTPVFRRVQAGRCMIRMSAVIGAWEKAYEASELALKLVPKLTLRSLENRDVQMMLSQDDMVGFGCDAAAAALNANKGPYAALNFLELGRGALIRSVSELRTDIVELRLAYPAMAQQFIQLRDELQTRGPRQYRASNEFQILLGEIRKKPGFECFLSPPTPEEVHKVAMYGPVVVLNVCRYRGSDAIIITRDTVQLLPLPNAQLEDLERWSWELENPSLLEWLWDFVAKPILDALKYNETRTEDTLPRLWWIPTGIFSKFPLHAAGYHQLGSTETVIDRVISSYSSSIQAMLDVRRRQQSFHQKESFTNPIKSLLVAMPTTPDHKALSHAVEEVEAVRNLLIEKKFDVDLLKDQPRTQDVLQNIEHAQIFHFAGHGNEDVLDPSRSSLILNDWEESPLTVDCMLDLNVKEGPRFLAYLSACGTGKITQAKFLDESIHLISAYQLAGFRHVIGTLWSVDDLACVQMAKDTYEEILKAPFTDAAVAKGLHKAARRLRNTCRDIRGSQLVDRKDDIKDRNIELVDDNAEGCMQWVPYVHFGV